MHINACIYIYICAKELKELEPAEHSLLSTLICRVPAGALLSSTVGVGIALPMV